MVDKKLTELDAITSVTADDLIYVVDDPLGTPLSKSIIAKYLRPYPDAPPVSPNTEDDEFDDDTLDGKWTETTDSANHDIDTTWKSCVYANFTGNQYYNIVQNYAPAGAFSITAKIHYALYQGNYTSCNIFAMDVDDSDQVQANYQYTTNVYGLNMHTRDASSWTYNRKTLPYIMSDHIYLHLQRDGSDNWGVWGSLDGYSYWICQSIYNKALTVHHFSVTLSQGGVTVPVRAGIDWVRRDWVTL